MRSFPCQHQGLHNNWLISRPNCCRSHHWPWTLSQHRTRHGSANPCCFSGFEYSSSCNRGHTCIHTYMHAYIHACIHTYMHACIHTYMHKYMYMSYIPTYRGLNSHGIPQQPAAQVSPTIAPLHSPFARHAILTELSAVDLRTMPDYDFMQYPSG